MGKRGWGGPWDGGMGRVFFEGGNVEWVRAKGVRNKIAWTLFSSSAVHFSPAETRPGVRGGGLS